MQWTKNCISMGRIGNWWSPCPSKSNINKYPRFDSSIVNIFWFFVSIWFDCPVPIKSPVDLCKKPKCIQLHSNFGWNTVSTKMIENVREKCMNGSFDCRLFKTITQWLTSILNQIVDMVPNQIGKEFNSKGTCHQMTISTYKITCYLLNMRLKNASLEASLPKKLRIIVFPLRVAPGKSIASRYFLPRSQSITDLFSNKKSSKCEKRSAAYVSE